MKLNKINIREFLQSHKKINPQELLNKITQDKNMFILGILVILVILYLDFSLVLKPQLRVVRELNPKISDLKIKLQQLNIDSIRMQSQTQGLKPGQGKEIISAGQMAWVIEEISRMANEQEVEILQIKPRRKVEASVSSKKPSLEKSYSPALIDLEISAGYHQLGRFLAELENYPVLLETEELDVMRNDKVQFNYQVELQLKTYVSE